MFLKDLFSFTPPQTEEGIIKTNVQLNPDHPIFKGHFPDQPVLPGVCMMQLVKALIEESTTQEVKLVKANEMKFLSFIHPTHDKLIQMELKTSIENDSISADARLLDNGTVLFKFKGCFTFK